MDDKEFLLNLTTPHRLEKILNAIKKESTLPKKFKNELINVIKSLAEGTKQAKSQGLITDEDFEKFCNSNKS